MKVKENFKSARDNIRIKMQKSRVEAAQARLHKPKGISNRFNRIMAMHRTKFNMLAGLASMVIAAFFGHIIIGFVVLGLAFFTAEWLSGGKE
jgi:membrane protein DedA with SNARE-associated domain